MEEFSTSNFGLCRHHHTRRVGRDFTVHHERFAHEARGTIWHDDRKAALAFDEIASKILEVAARLRWS